jgi:hypothetical protein
MILIGCGTRWGEAQRINFQINLDTWTKSTSISSEAVSHYGLMVIDGLEKRKVYENPDLKPGGDVNVELEKKRTYYILLIAYDKNNQVLNTVEKEISV